MPVVFVPNRGAHDYSDAERYGELKFVSTGQQNKYSVGTMTRMWIKALKKSSEDDYIMVTSLTVLCCIGCAIYALYHGSLNLLLFRDGRYMARRLMLNQSIEDNKEEENEGQ